VLMATVSTESPKQIIHSGRSNFVQRSDTLRNRAGGWNNVFTNAMLNRAP